ncbi:Hexokinase-3 [Raphanus sativus]|nr:Hexokinase-3 [Raphanus sativus]
MGKVAVTFFAAAAVVAACSVAGVVVRRRVKSQRKWRTVVEILKEFEEGCDTHVGRLRQVVDAMAVEMHAGLASEGGSKLIMLLTYVHDFPNGAMGSFQLSRLFIGKVYPKRRNESNSRLGVKRELAFTFSFPVKHTTISSGVLIKWTKGFEISEMVGEDIGECLQGALNRKGLDIHVAALVNDTVGALSLGYYHDPDTVVAVVFGTGSNACYLERTDAIIKCQGLLTASGSMVVNMEWRNFWFSHLPRTTYDMDLDAESSNPNDMGFEKMIAGLYLGDIVRRVIHRMSQQSDIF